MRAVLCGYYGMGNGGDEALLASLLQLLPDHVEPIVLSGDPEQTRDRYKVEACDRKSLPAVLSALRTSDAFIWGGGSLMQDSTSAMNPVYYGGLMRLAQVMGLKTIAWAQGIGPLKRSWVKGFTRSTFKHCTQVSVRDRASAALLHDWQIPFTLAPDPVWAMESTPLTGLWNLPAPRVAVNLRSHRHLTPERLAVFTRALVNFQKATQTCLLLLPFQASQDFAIAQSLHEQLPEVSHILQIKQPQELKGVFRGVEMTIAMRLHGLIMASAEGCRCFGLSYDPKVTQLMSDLEMPGCAIADLPTDANELSRIWIDLYANGDALSDDQIHSLVDRALFHQMVLEQALESTHG
ncbi:MAG: polysaccharide pyruvyl transferase CsaB [Plectolyngbya sp. WJT66-NPBG17]|nr:polysaccharide pyruvyl transferase CsaB [Plectolyngbya sp. WJT66-NPBG17]MBW4524236.1 polysaccharide pyruvyl transferase CsaB [Phormidium tanganyikae FI6-MK23]